MFISIQDADQIREAQTILEQRVQDQATRRGPIMFGYQGGGNEAIAHWVRPLDFWISFADSGNRYWNALGLGNPFKGDKTIIAEINPPKSGLNRRVAGVFVLDSAGKICLAHRGGIGGGRKGIGKQAFFSWYQGDFERISDDGIDSKIIVIGALDDDRLIENLAAFTRSVSDFKQKAVSRLLGT